MLDTERDIAPSNTAPPEKPLLLAIGHSHLGAVQVAYHGWANAGGDCPFRTRFLRLNKPRFQPQFDASGGQRVLTDTVMRPIAHIIKKERPTAVLLAAMGNEINALGLVQHPTPFDFAYSGYATDPTAWQIPFEMMRDTVLARAENGMLLFYEYVKTFGVRVIVLPPPPPVFDEKHILRYPGNFGDRLNDHGVSSADLRHKLWHLYFDILASRVQPEGDTILPPPAAALDERGFLAPAFLSGDPTHANADYGTLILEGLGALVKEWHGSQDTVGGCR